MDLELSDEQRDLQASARQVLDRHAPLSLARTFLEGRADARSLWSELRQLGWYAVGLDDDDAFGLVGLCLLAHECGRHAAPTVLVDTAVAARIVSECPSAAEQATPIPAGEMPVALAFIEPGTDWSGAALSRAERVDRGYHITATKLGVHHAEQAAWLAVFVATHDGVGMALVDPHATGVEVSPSPGFDGAAGLHRVELVDVFVADDLAFLKARPVRSAFAAGALATSAEGLGAAEAAFDMAIAYSLERRQFGRQIGSFQALQHLMADLHALRETATAAVLYAAASLDGDAEQGAEAAMIANAHCTRATRTIVEGALQVLGGIAFTWEHDVHLLQRRVHECERRFGDALHYERAVAAALLGGHRSIERSSLVTHLVEEAQ